MLRRLIKPLTAQFAGLLFVYSLSRNGILPALAPIWLAGVQGAFAAIVSLLLMAPRWWVPIHMLFLPTLVGAIWLELPTTVYASCFCILALVYWTTFRTQVPLFLSNKITLHRLAIWLADNKPLKVLDVGSGTGSFVLGLAHLRPDWAVEGIEAAPGPYLLSRLLGRDLPNLTLTRGDFWQHSLRDYDLVYAFLSPVPMPALWRKARREMRPGSLLVSNSFDIPDQPASEIVGVDDPRGTRLYVYRIPGGKAGK